MLLSESISNIIVKTASTYIGRPYDYKTFDCVHFIVSVYKDVGIFIPRFGSEGYPPSNLHLDLSGFQRMPRGHSVFFKRKTSMSSRVWTHMALIFSSTHLVHCSRHCGSGVVVTPRDEFLEMYSLAPQRPC